MDVLDIMLLALVYTSVIAGIAVATPRVGGFIASAMARLRGANAATPAE